MSKKRKGVIKWCAIGAGGIANESIAIVASIIGVIIYRKKKADA